MSSVRLDIRDRIIEELNADRPMDVPEVTHRRWVPSESDVAAHMSVVFVEEPVRLVGGRGGSIANRVLTIGVQCVASTSDPSLADDLVEPMLAWATKILGPSNLNGLAHFVEELGTTWEPAKLDKLYLLAVQRWQIDYQTRRDDIEQKQ